VVVAIDAVIGPHTPQENGNKTRPKDNNSRGSVHMNRRRLIKRY